ncbi:MAG: flagellar motor switch protein FliN [Acidobacteria bacterium]|nr:flagellar motor switch protein FliN [Acidobacteriota bacterium]
MPTNRDLEQWLAEDLTVRLRQAIASMTGETPEVECRPSRNTGGELLWLANPLSAGADAVIYAGAPEPAWSAIGRKVLTSAGIDEPGESDLRSTYQEILSQAMSSHAQAIGGRLRREVVCDAATEGQPPEGGLRLEFVIGLGEGPLPALRMVFSAGLLAVLDPEQNAQAQQASQGGAALEQVTRADLPPSVTNSRTLELLLEVELPVSVSFGRAQLPLKDVLKLTSGSIVELNRSVNEPVEIIINNCVIARGEVVVVEGNYGVRIHHIISRQERLRTLN